MNRAPEIGEAVWVPWGFDKVPGEVRDLFGDHAVVDVIVQGSSGEELDRESVHVRIDSLDEYPSWQVRRSHKGAPKSGADAVDAWYIDAERNGDSARVEVRVSGTLAASTVERNDDVREALRSNGKSAVRKFARRYRLPRVIVIATTGVYELRD